MKRISTKLAASILLAAMGVLAVFHVLVLVEVLPSEMVWGGRIEGPSDNLAILETMALIITLIFALIIAAKVGYVKIPRLRKVVHIGAWVVFAYFTLNIIGNLTSSTSVEKLIFTPVSVVLAALAWRVAIEKLGVETQTPVMFVPSAAVFFNSSRNEWLVEPVDAMRGGIGVHNREKREVVPDGESANLPEAVRRALASCRMIEVGPIPKYPSWTKQVREHHLLFVYIKGDQCVIDPQVREHVGRGGSYAPLVSRELRLPVEADDDQFMQSLREALRRARDEEDVW